MLRDFCAGVAGIMVCIALLVFGRPGFWVVVILLVFTSLFAIYLFRIFQRNRCYIEMDPQGLRVYASSTSSVVRRQLAWDELERLDLNYYCTRRDGREGWLDLRLRGAGAAISFDSRLLGFEQILEQSVDAASCRGIAISDASAANLASIGFGDTDQEARKSADAIIWPKH